MLDYGKATRRRYSHSATGIPSRARAAVARVSRPRPPAPPTGRRSPAKLTVAVTPRPHSTSRPPAPLDRRLRVPPRQGRRRQVDGRRRARGCSPRARPARDRRRGEPGRGDVSRALGRERAPASPRRELAPGLFTISIDPRAGAGGVPRDQLPVRALAERLSSSRTFGYVAAATPGLRELLTIGKIWELAQPQRRTPGRRALRPRGRRRPGDRPRPRAADAPRTFAAAAAVGPIARQARDPRHARDPGRTALAGRGDARPRPPSTRRSHLRDALRAELGLELDAVVVNAVEPRRFSRSRRGALLSAAASRSASRPRRSPAARCAPRARPRRARAPSRRSVARLRRALDRAPVALPHLFAAALGRRRSASWPRARGSAVTLGARRDARRGHEPERRLEGSALHLRRRGRSRQDDHRRPRSRSAWRGAGSASRWSRSTRRRGSRPRSGSRSSTTSRAWSTRRCSPPTASSCAASCGR